MHKAAWNNSKDVAELLIIKGAEVNAKTEVNSDLILISDRILLSSSYDDELLYASYYTCMIIL